MDEQHAEYNIWSTVHHQASFHNDIHVQLMFQQLANTKRENASDRKRMTFSLLLLLKHNTCIAHINTERM